MQNQSIRQRIINMEVGEIIGYPVGNSSYSTLRSYACEIGLSFNRKYSTSLSRKQGIINVTRLS